VAEQRKQYGVLLPHFGAHASRERIVESARRIEAYGFDSVWVRDHLVFHPHHSENPDRTFIDPFVVLSAVAVVTDRLVLAAGAFIPHRHPVHTALLFGSLDLLAGPNRILAGWGLGSFDHEFQAAGMAGWNRREVLQEQVEIWRQLWTGGEVSHEGQYYSFERVEIQPVPAGGSVPIWYCGSSPAAVRRAVEYCDGWIPARMPRRDYRKRMQRMRQLAEQAGKPIPQAGTIPYLSPGRSMEEALRAVNVPATLAEASQRYRLPNSGRLQTIDDLDGATIVGPPEKIIEEVREHQAAGGLHFVFDMRLRFDDWEDCLQLIGEEVLPQLKRGD
jgi:probable F420-dependent oxidoreductase